ncbi:hypothetical protein CR513_35134, partial [Mucuna pruriens]
TRLKRVHGHVFITSIWEIWLIRNYICFGRSSMIHNEFHKYLSNVVMVRKPSDKWTMCINYTDLNKACLKDPYHLPSIDALVDEASG